MLEFSNGSIFLWRQHRRTWRWRRILVCNFIPEIVSRSYGDGACFNVSVALGGEKYFFPGVRVRTFLSPSGFRYLLFKKIIHPRVMPRGTINPIYWMYAVEYANRNLARVQNDNLVEIGGIK